LTIDFDKAVKLGSQASLNISQLKFGSRRLHCYADEVKVTK